MNARTNPHALIGERMKRDAELRFASLFAESARDIATCTNASVKPGDALHPAQILENMRAAMRAMPPAPFNGAQRLVVDPGTMEELRHAGKVEDKLGGPITFGLEISTDRSYPPNTAMGFRRRGTGIADELVWSNRFDVKATEKASIDALFAPLRAA